MKPDRNSREFLEAISVEQMRKADAYTIENFVSGRELMYRAAFGVFQAVQWEDKKTAIIAGSGNNGGDGYALAGILADHGIRPEIFRTSEKLSADGAYYYEQCVSKGVKVQFFSEDTNLTSFDIIVDCILGTGFQGTPRGTAAMAIHRINEALAYVVSVDINSGLNGDTGEAKLAVKSDLTVSIGYYKKGLFLNKAQEYIGDLINVDIGIVFPASDLQKIPDVGADMERRLQNIEIRRIEDLKGKSSDKYSLLDDFLYDAIYLPEGAAPPPREIIRRPELAVYVENFGQPDDLCLVAESQGQIIGAVWTRILAGEPKGYGNIDEHTPEFAISVKKEFRRRGIGKRLMQEMILLLREKGYKQASLSVNKENYAYQMYRKLGFRVIKEQDEDYLMVLKL